MSSDGGCQHGPPCTDCWHTHKLTHTTRTFELQANSLTGTIPPGLCAAGAPLRVINLRANSLSGPASALLGCKQLEILDLGSNALTGPLPAAAVSVHCK